MPFKPGHTIGNRFQPGNRIRAGQYQYRFNDEQLRGLLLMPGLRWYRAFIDIHRDQRPLGEVAAEVGMRPASLSATMYEARQAIGLNRQDVRPEVLLRERWHAEYEGAAPGTLRAAAPRQFPWNAEIEARAKTYFLGHSFKQYQICRLAFVEKRTRQQIAEALGVPEPTVRAAIHTLYRRRNVPARKLRNFKGSSWQQSALNS